MVSKFPVSLISIYTIIFEIVVNYFVFKEYLNFLPLIFRHIFVDFVEKEPSAKFSGLLISFHEVIKSHGFECGVMHSKWTERFTPDFIFILFSGKEPKQFHDLFDHSSRIFEDTSSKWLNSFWTK